MLVNNSIEQVVESFIDACNRKIGWSLVRINDAESEILSGNIYKHDPDWRYPYPGMGTVAKNIIHKSTYDFIRNKIIGSIKLSDFVGAGVDNHGRFYNIFTGCGLDYPPKNSCFVWINHHFITRKKYCDELKKRRCLLIGDPMPVYANKYKEFYKSIDVFHGIKPKEFLENTRVIGDGGSISIYTEDGFNQIAEYIRKSDSEIVLLSMGVWAPPLAIVAKECGKIGIDFGSGSYYHLDQYTYNTQYNTIVEYLENNKGILENKLYYMKDGGYIPVGFEDVVGAYWQEIII